VLQRGRQRRTEEGDADPLDPGVRLDLQGNKLVKRPEGRSAGKRIVGGQLHNL
jgi:hypothetical protein